MLDRKYAQFATEKAIELLNIDSPTGFTKEAAEYVKKQFEQLGFSATITNKGGVLLPVLAEDMKELCSFAMHRSM